MATKKIPSEEKEYNVTVRRTLTSFWETTVDVRARSWNEARKIAREEAREFPGRFDWTEV